MYVSEVIASFIEETISRRQRRVMLIPRILRGEFWKEYCPRGKRAREISRVMNIAFEDGKN